MKKVLALVFILFSSVAFAVDQPPVVAGDCSVDYSTWVASCTNTSTDDNGIQLAYINWGDGTVVSTITGKGEGPFTHTFLLPMAYSITLYVVDTAGQQNSLLIGNTIAANFQFFSVTGKVLKKDGTGLGAALVQVKKGTTVVKSTMSTATGAYSLLNMKPGVYTIVVIKLGYTFSSLIINVPPSATEQNFTAN